MTTKTLGHLVLAVVLAGSTVAALQTTGTPPESAPRLSAAPSETEAAPSAGGLFFVLPLASDRLTATCAGLKVAPPPIVCLTP